ncbi:hypothetical protein BH18ACI4_BH18ACI4_23830 [soil metagenome]
MSLMPKLMTKAYVYLRIKESFLCASCVPTQGKRDTLPYTGNPGNPTTNHYAYKKIHGYFRGAGCGSGRVAANRL